MTRFGCAVVFGLAGGQLASFAARVPAIQDRAGLSAGALGLAFLALEAGALLGLPLGGALCGRYGSRASLRIGLVVYPVGLAAIPLAPFVALPVCALGTSVVDVAMNVQGLELERRSGQQLLSRLHGAHSLGVLAGGVGGTVAAAAAVPVDVHLLMVAALGLIGGQLATSVLVREPLRADRPSFGIPRGRLAGLGVLAFGAFLIDGAASNWSAAQVRDAGGGEGLAAAGFAAFALGLTIGRLRGDRTDDGTRVVRRSGVIAAAGIAATLLAPAPAVSVAGWLVVGLGVAAVAPTIMRAAGATPGSIATVTTIGYLGSFTGPPIIGGVASFATLSAGLLVPLLAALALVALAGRWTDR